MLFKVGMRVSLPEIAYDGAEINEGERGTVVALYPELGGVDIKLDTHHPELWRWGNTVHFVSPETEDVITSLETVTRRKQLPACITNSVATTLCISLLPLKPLAALAKPLGHAMTHPMALVVNWICTASAFASEGLTEWAHLL